MKLCLHMSQFERKMALLSSAIVSGLHITEIRSLKPLREGSRGSNDLRLLMSAEGMYSCRQCSRTCGN